MTMPRVTRFVQTLNKAQQQALFRVYDRRPIKAPAMDARGNHYLMSYRQFRRTVQFSYDCAMVPWCGMWLGIEHDGYTHS
jgi:hypothetical protein